MSIRHSGARNLPGAPRPPMIQKLEWGGSSPSRDMLRPRPELRTGAAERWNSPRRVNSAQAPRSGGTPHALDPSRPLWLPAPRQPEAVQIHGCARSVRSEAGRGKCTFREYSALFTENKLFYENLLKSQDFTLFHENHTFWWKYGPPQDIK